MQKSIKQTWKNNLRDDGLTWEEWLATDCKQDFDKTYCDSFCLGEGCKERDICEAYNRNNT